MIFVQQKALISACRTLYSFSPINTTVNVFLMFLQSVTAGAGILLIMPMLSMIGVNEQATIGSALTEYVSTAFNAVSITLNLSSILILYVILLSLIAFLHYILAIRILTTQQAIVRHYRNQLYQYLLKCRWSFIIDSKMSDFNQSLTIQVESLGVAFQLLLQLFSQLIKTLIFVILAYTVSWEIALLSLVLAVLLFLIIKPINARIYSHSKIRWLNFRDYFQMIGEHLGSFKLIKAFSAEGYSSNEIYEAGYNLERQTIRVAKVNALSKLAYTIISICFIAGVFYVSIGILSVELSTIILLSIIFSRLIPSLSSVLSIYNKLLSEMPSIEDVANSIEQCKNNKEIKEQQHVGEIKFEKLVEFKNVSYRYPNKKAFAFENLSFIIKPNQITAIVGVSGAGKTTIADLLMGLLSPTKGNIRCDDIILNRSNSICWRKQVAYVTQENHLFHKTIRENLSWVKLNLEDADIWSALEQASAKHFVQNLPHGLNTIVGDRGVNISGGERQRLALARTLLLQPKLLILDEATSALDKVNEERIRNVLMSLKKKMAIIVIAHSPITIKEADVVISLN